MTVHYHSMSPPFPWGSFFKIVFSFPLESGELLAFSLLSIFMNHPPDSILSHSLNYYCLSSHSCQHIHSLLFIFLSVSPPSFSLPSFRLCLCQISLFSCSAVSATPLLFDDGSHFSDLLQTTVCEMYFMFELLATSSFDSQITLFIMNHVLNLFELQCVCILSEWLKHYEQY